MVSNQTFWKYLWTLRFPFLWLTLFGLPLEFLIFKWIYPFPNFRGDSASYIGAAMANVDAAEWPVGYSKFLRAIHWVSHSDMLLVTIQYTLLELSGIFFILTIQYFVRMNKYIFSILFAFMILNPLFLHLGNYIMSDALFTSLSLLWITQLIWIIYRPSPMQTLGHSLLLLCLFMVRYNAIFYPLVSIVAFILSHQRWVMKAAGLALAFALIAAFVGYTKNKFYELDGIRQFSPFGGWQLANNALYTYRTMQPDNTVKLPPQYNDLDSIVRQSFVEARKEGLVLNPYIKDYYIWDPSSPLWQYTKYRWRADTATDTFTKWVSMGPLFSSYGSYLIEKYPVNYFQEFFLPNTKNFFSPLIADLYYYNQGINRLDIREARWFDYKKPTISPPAGNNYVINVLKPYPLISNILNLSFLLTMFTYLLFKEFKVASAQFNHIFIVFAVFWVFNFGFSSFASSVELRYQVFQLTLNFCFVMTLLNSYLRPASVTDLQTKIAS